MPLELRDLVWISSCGKFVVYTVGGRYDARDRSPNRKFRFHRALSVVLTILVACALALPVGAQDNTANATGQVVKANLHFRSATHLAGTELTPGIYTVTADSSKVTLSQRSKTVAEAPIQWKGEQGKARHSSVVSESGQVREIHFAGRTQYILIVH